MLSMPHFVTIDALMYFVATDLRNTATFGSVEPATNTERRVLMGLPSFAALGVGLPFVTRMGGLSGVVFHWRIVGEFGEPIGTGGGT